jgi:putative ABC transport system permease protein
VAIAGRPPASGEEALAYMTAVTGDYFKAMGVPLLAGRLMDRTDTAASQPVVLVSRRAAQQFWRGADPIGSTVRFRFSGKPFDAQVVGVVGDVRHEALNAPEAAEVFLPYAQSGFHTLTFVVRTSPASPVDLQTLKDTIWAIDPLQSIYNTARLDALISKTLVGQRFNLFVLAGFALATLMLAMAGVYGVMSLSTGLRAQEFGIRVALGATSGDIVRLVVGEGVKLAAFGVVAGVLVALPLTSLLRTLVFGVKVTDPLTFVTVTFGLTLTAAAACYIPARRALTSQPSDVLRLD